MADPAGAARDREDRARRVGAKVGQDRERRQREVDVGWLAQPIGHDRTNVFNDGQRLTVVRGVGREIEQHRRSRITVRVEEVAPTGDAPAGAERVADRRGRTAPLSVAQKCDHVVARGAV